MFPASSRRRCGRTAGLFATCPEPADRMLHDVRLVIRDGASGGCNRHAALYAPEGDAHAADPRPDRSAAAAAPTPRRVAWLPAISGNGGGNGRIQDAVRFFHWPDFRRTTHCISPAHNSPVHKRTHSDRTTTRFRSNGNPRIFEMLQYSPPNTTPGESLSKKFYSAL